ncbi:hypothetical protein [Escherichia phage PJNS034]
MSINMSSGDLRLYWGGCYAPVAWDAADSGVATLVIHDVRVINPMSRDYTEARVQGELFFIRNGEEARGNFEGRMSDLLGDGFTTPQRNIGYIRVHGQPYWITFKRRRTNRKGITNDRLAVYVAGHRGEAGLNFGSDVLCRLYATFDGRISDDFCIHQNMIHYKGVVVGRYERHNRIVLAERFAYLSWSLERIGGYDVTVEVE